MKTKRRILPRLYFNRPTVTVARSLIGKYLVRSIDGRMLAGKIVEVEAYVGPHDKACHAPIDRTYEILANERSRNRDRWTIEIEAWKNSVLGLHMASL